MLKCQLESVWVCRYKYKTRATCHTHTHSLIRLLSVCHNWSNMMTSVDICHCQEKKKRKKKRLFWLFHHTIPCEQLESIFNCQRKAPSSEVVASLTYLSCCQFLTQFLIRCHLAHFAAFRLDLLHSVLWGTTWFGINPYPLYPLTFHPTEPKLVCHGCILTSRF